LPGILDLLVSGIVLNCFLASTAHAYIDPGTGSMVVQVMGALVAGGIFYFRESLLRVKGLLLRRSKPADDSAHPASGDDLAP
jgi:hypothetical protein